MPWNPLRAISNAIGGLFGRGEQAPAPGPAPAPEPSRPAPEPSAPAVEGRGGLAGFWDRLTGADRRREETAERERQLAERERQIEERERQLAERERAISPPPPAPEPSVPAPAPSGPEHDLPKFGADVAEFISRDERAFGTDSDIGREFDSAVADFVADRGGLDGLSVDAAEWLQSPTISQPFSEYWQSGGFTADQVLAGMTNISNITIVEGEDGDIHIEFDYDSVVDGYEVSGHASA